MSTVGETTVHTSWRCPRMREHLRGGCTCHPQLPTPCPDCYSLRVISVTIPYEKPTPWKPAT